MGSNGTTRPVPPSEDTFGKTVTLPKGIVVTDCGAYHGDPLVRRCVDDAGGEHMILARVVRELPVTVRRDTLDVAKAWQVLIS